MALLEESLSQEELLRRNHSSQILELPCHDDDDLILGVPPGTGAGDDNDDDDNSIKFEDLMGMSNATVNIQNIRETSGKQRQSISSTSTTIPEFGPSDDSSEENDVEALFHASYPVSKSPSPLMSRKKAGKERKNLVTGKKTKPTSLSEAQTGSLTTDRHHRHPNRRVSFQASAGSRYHDSFPTRSSLKRSVSFALATPNSTSSPKDRSSSSSSNNNNNRAPPSRHHAPREPRRIQSLHSPIQSLHNSMPILSPSLRRKQQQHQQQRQSPSSVQSSFPLEFGPGFSPGAHNHASVQRRRPKLVPTSSLSSSFQDVVGLVTKWKHEDDDVVPKQNVEKGNQGGEEIIMTAREGGNKSRHRHQVHNDSAARSSSSRRRRKDKNNNNNNDNNKQQQLQQLMMKQLRRQEDYFDRTSRTERQALDGYWVEAFQRNYNSRRRGQLRQKKNAQD